MIDALNSSAITELKRRIYPWIQPIPGDDPAGIDIQHDRDWAMIREQIDRLASPSPKPIYWDEVIDRSILLLRGQSKDLRIACYLTVALQQTQGLNGLATGLYLVSTMLDGYWPILYPPLRRLRARESVIKWLVERVEGELKNYQISPNETLFAQLFAGAVQHFAEIVGQRFSTTIASMTYLLGRAQEYLYVTRQSSQHPPNHVEGGTLFGAALPSRIDKLDQDAKKKSQVSHADIRVVRGREAIAGCFTVMAELRPHLQSFNFVDTCERLSARFGYQLVAAYVADHPVTVGGFRMGESLAWGKYIYIEDLVTSSQHRSSGHGEALFTWIVNFAREQGCQQVHLDSGVQRFAAHRFYLQKRMQISSHHFCLMLEPD